MFRHAESFLRAAELLATDRELTLPYLATATFALELLLKALLQSTRGKVPKVHNLLVLYRDLPSAERERLGTLHRHFHRAHHPDSDDREADRHFGRLLEALHDAHRVSRYPYEFADRERPDPTPLTAALRGRLLELRPEWRGGGSVDPTRRG